MHSCAFVYHYLYYYYYYYYYYYKIALQSNVDLRFLNALPSVSSVY